jgi:hypothetical protein
MGSGWQSSGSAMGAESFIYRALRWSRTHKLSLPLIGSWVKSIPWYNLSIKSRVFHLQSLGFVHLQNRNKNIYVLGLVWELNETMSTNTLVQFPEHQCMPSQNWFVWSTKCISDRGRKNGQGGGDYARCGLVMESLLDTWVSIFDLPKPYIEKSLDWNEEA